MNMFNVLSDSLEHEKQKELIAFHEAGHAVVLEKLKKHYCARLYKTDNSNWNGLVKPINDEDMKPKNAIEGLGFLAAGVVACRMYVANELNVNMTDEDLYTHVHRQHINGDFKDLKNDKNPKLLFDNMITIANLYLENTWPRIKNISEILISNNIYVN